MTIEPDNKTNEIHTIHKLAIKKKKSHPRNINNFQINN